MDTRINSLATLSSSSHPPTLFISPRELVSLVGCANAPLLLDVRPQARFDASKQMLATARRCAPEDLLVLTAELIAAEAGVGQRPIVTYCVYGHHVSMNAAAQLRAAGLNARALAGGFEGGEVGVDNAELIAQWRQAALQKVMKVAT